jgi:WD40 repeat protein
MHPYSTAITKSVVILLCFLASTAASDELKGKVTAANGTLIEVATDSEYLPNVGDKVEIFIELKAIQSTALVTTGSVTGVNGESIVVQIDNPMASVVVGQLARIDAPQPVKKGDAAMPPPAGATITSALPGSKPLTEVRRFSGHEGVVWSVAFAPDGHRAISGGSDDAVRLWNVETGQEVRRFQTGGHSLCVAFSANGSRIAWGTNHFAVVYDLQNDQQLAEINGEYGLGRISSVAFSPDGNTLLTGSTGGPARLWDIATMQEIRRFEPMDRNADPFGGTAPRAVNRAVFSPDGRLVLCGTGFVLSTWDVRSGQQVREFQGENTNADRAVFSSRGQYLLAGANWSAPVQMWDVQSGQEVGRFVGHPGGAEAIAFLPGDRRILTGSSGEQTRVDPGGEGFREYSVRLWDVNTGKETYRFEGHNGPVSCIAVSPDGNYALTASQDSTIRLWRLPK